MVYAGSYQLAVALDPVGSAAQDEDLKSQIHVLHCEKKGLADLGGDNPRSGASLRMTSEISRKIENFSC